MALLTLRSVGVLLAGFGFAAAALAAEPEAVTPAAEAAKPEEPGAFDNDKAHGYLGLGLIAASSSFQTPLVPDVDAEGGGIGVRGVAHSGQVNASLDIGFSGGFALMSRTDDATDEEVGDFLYELDGGLRFSDLFYVSLGVMSQTTAYENPDIATTYGVIPVGLGVLHTSESGYVLAQLRGGGGRLSNDQNDDTEGVGYIGLRAVVQHGFGPGVQFLLGLGFDRYTLGNNTADDFVRLEFGLGFGL